MKLTKTELAKRARVLPDGVPRWVRIYDSNEPGDRYTVVFTGNWKGRTSSLYLGMSGAPFHPQGVCQHGESERAIDCRQGNWGGVSVGRKCHLGTRINFADLPKDCQTAVLMDYRRLWNL